METYRKRRLIPDDIYENSILANYFGGWSNLAKRQYDQLSEEKQIDILCLLSKHHEVEAYGFFKPESLPK